jgi:hypothetical protein
MRMISGVDARGMVGIRNDVFASENTSSGDRHFTPILSANLASLSEKSAGRPSASPTKKEVVRSTACVVPIRALNIAGLGLCCDFFVAATKKYRQVQLGHCDSNLVELPGLRLVCKYDKHES